MTLRNPLSLDKAISCNCKPGMVQSNPVYRLLTSREGREAQEVKAVAMWIMADERSKDPAFIKFTLQALGLNNLRDQAAAIAAIDEWISTNILFMPELGEHIRSPWMTLEIGAGDCDDMSTLALAMALSIGIDGRLRWLKMGAQSGWNEGWHVYPELRDEYGGRVWIPIDPAMPEGQKGPDLLSQADDSFTFSHADASAGYIPMPLYIKLSQDPDAILIVAGGQGGCMHLPVRDLDAAGELSATDVIGLISGATTALAPVVGGVIGAATGNTQLGSTIGSLGQAAGQIGTGITGAVTSFEKGDAGAGLAAIGTAAGAAGQSIGTAIGTATGNTQLGTAIGGISQAAGATAAGIGQAATAFGSGDTAGGFQAISQSAQLAGAGIGQAATALTGNAQLGSTLGAGIGAAGQLVDTVGQVVAAAEAGNPAAAVGAGIAGAAGAAGGIIATIPPLGPLIGGIVAAVGGFVSWLIGLFGGETEAEKKQRELEEAVTRADQALNAQANSRQNGIIQMATRAKGATAVFAELQNYWGMLIARSKAEGKRVYQTDLYKPFAEPGDEAPWGLGYLMIVPEPGTTVSMFDPVRMKSVSVPGFRLASPQDIDAAANSALQQLQAWANAQGQNIQSAQQAADVAIDVDTLYQIGVDMSGVTFFDFITDDANGIPTGDPWALLWGVVVTTMGGKVAADMDRQRAGIVPYYWTFPAPAVAAPAPTPTGRDLLSSLQAGGATALQAGQTIKQTQPAPTPAPTSAPAPIPVSTPQPPQALPTVPYQQPAATLSPALVAAVTATLQDPRAIEILGKDPAGRDKILPLLDPTARAAVEGALALQEQAENQARAELGQAILDSFAMRTDDLSPEELRLLDLAIDIDNLSSANVIYLNSTRERLELDPNLKKSIPQGQFLRLQDAAIRLGLQRLALYDSMLDDLDLNISKAPINPKISLENIRSGMIGRNLADMVRILISRGMDERDMRLWTLTLEKFHSELRNVNTQINSLRLSIAA